MLVKCEACNGNGYFQMEGTKVCFECAACKGKGGFDVPDNKELCPKCNGTGSAYVRADFGVFVECDCKNCFGTGFIDKK